MDKIENNFEQQWEKISLILHEGLRINNWGASQGYTGRYFIIHEIKNEFIAINSPSAKTLQVIPKGDFLEVWKVWTKYLNNIIPRFFIRDEITRYSSYIISIFHYIKMCENVDKQ